MTARSTPASGSGTRRCSDLLLESPAASTSKAAARRAIADGTQQLLTAPDDATARAWQAAATANARALIQTVPGSGPVLGVWEYPGASTPWRNNVGATAAVMWKATAAGWVQVALGYTIDFTSGGTYVDRRRRRHHRRDSSGKTATVMRIVTTSGSWSAGTAAGYVVVASASARSLPARTSTSAAMPTSRR
jgi:hypothetical protein